jgi:hypothetical protein
MNVGLAIGAAGVVDVARNILARRAVDRTPAGDGEKILVGDAVGLLVGEAGPEIFDDAGALGDILAGEQPDAGGRALRVQLELSGNIAAFHCRRCWHAQSSKSRRCSDAQRHVKPNA